MTIPFAVADLSGAQGTAGSPYSRGCLRMSAAAWFSGRTLARVGCLTKDRREKGQGVPKPARIAAPSFVSKPPGHHLAGLGRTGQGCQGTTYVLCRKGSQQSASYTPHIRGGPPGLLSWQGRLHGAALSFRDGSRAVEQARKPQKPTPCCETMADARHQQRVYFSGGVDVVSISCFHDAHEPPYFVSLFSMSRRWTKCSLVKPFTILSTSCLMEGYLCC